MTPDLAANFAIWITRNAPPSLQELVARFSSYSAITPEAWRDYDARMERWEELRRLRLK
jgi:hypothetical protein